MNIEQIQKKIIAFEEAVICMQFKPDALHIYEDIENDYFQCKKDLLSALNEEISNEYHNASR